MKVKMNHHEMPMLAGIAGIIRWVEELANLVSGPLLTLGLGVALVDLLTDGSLLTRMPLLLYAWAISQAIGVDARLVATWDRARIALREQRFWALVGLMLLGIVLAYVAWVAAQGFALQESEGVATGVALARLGMDSAGWLVQRTALSVFLVCLAGWTRYHPPVKDVALSAEEERQKLEADLLVEPLRQQKRALQARGMRGVMAAAMGREGKETAATDQAPRFASLMHTAATAAREASALSDAPEGPSEPPEPPASPTPTRRVRNGRKTSGKVLRLRNPSVEDRARAAWQPGMSVRALEKTAGISRASAQKYAAMFGAEQSAQSEQTSESLLAAR